MTFDVATSSDIELAEHCRKLVRTIGSEEAKLKFVASEVERQTREHEYHQSNPLCALCGDRTHWMRDCPRMAQRQQPESRNSGEPPSGATDPSQGPGRAEKKKKKKKQSSQ